MDENDINDLARNCTNLKHKFIGVFAANNYQKNMKENNFLLFNSATAEKSFNSFSLVTILSERQPVNFCRPVRTVCFIIQRHVSKNSIARRKFSGTAIVKESPNSKQKLQTRQTLLYLYCPCFFSSQKIVNIIFYFFSQNLIFSA